jgi:2-succinyl-5-enolpyruvyl-6-hydroxy-3-cyclohexene-1-carboxylate synthase
MTHSNIPLAQSVVQLCKAKNISHIVISPGSRNAPLTIGFTGDDFFTCYSIVDERCAAFFALGIAQQIQHPVAVVCTSGSALLNYYPAVAEAFYSDIPLVVISADRPEKLVNIGDGQTINQPNVYGNHILYSAHASESLEKSEVEINNALNTSIVSKGPVHINVPFTEPLYGTTKVLNVSPNNIPAQEITSNFTEDLDEFINTWNTSTKKMVLVGVLAPNSIEEKLLEELALDPSVLVFTETTSNLYHKEFFPSIDKIIAPIEKHTNSDAYFKELQPEVLLTLGGMVVSKKIKAFLRKYQPNHHWHVDTKKSYNTYFCLSKHFKTSPQQFFTQFLYKTETNTTSTYKAYWSVIKQQRVVKHKEYIKQISFSDFCVFNEVLQSIPNNYMLQLSNSSTIRYTQLFDINPSLQVFCNRGTSGIDGSTAAAIGASLMYVNPTLFITGDLSFFYDSNALWNNYIRSDFRIIVINNGGGGIFRILPGDKNATTFDTYFETKHKLTAEQLCKMYDFEYLSADNKKATTQVLQQFYKEENKPKLLEIFTPSTINDEVLLSYFSFLNKEN